MNQKPLFISDIYDALSDVVRALGGPKAVGALMRPELPADQAGRWVSDCLNREHRTRFDPEHVLWLLKQARAAESHAAMAWIEETCGYAPPVPVNPEDEAVRLQREMVGLMARMETLASQLRINHKLPGGVRVVG